MRNGQHMRGLSLKRSQRPIALQRRQQQQPYKLPVVAVAAAAPLCHPTPTHPRLLLLAAVGQGQALPLPLPTVWASVWAVAAAQAFPLCHHLLAAHPPRATSEVPVPVVQ